MLQMDKKNKINNFWQIGGAGDGRCGGADTFPTRNRLLNLESGS